MIDKIIHQIFFTINKNFEDFPIFVKSKKEWQEWCKNNNYKYKFYTEKDIEILLNNEMKSFYNGLRYNWQRIDFCRYLIINKYGGVYIDLDIEPNYNNNLDFNKYIESSKYLLNKWYDPKKNKFEITNALMAFPSNSLNDLIKYSINETNKRKNNETYKKWKIRYMLQTTGVRMFKRYCKINKLNYSEDINKYVIDYCTATWLNDFN